MRAPANLRPLPAEVRGRLKRLGLDGDGSLPHMLSRTAERWPDAPAVSDLVTGRSLRYRELLAEVTSLTAYLRMQGVRQGDVVLLQSPNSVQLLIAWWAAWRAGCTCVPIVDIYRAHELTSIVDAVRPDVVMTVAEHRGHAPPAMFDALLAGSRFSAKAKITLEGEADGWITYADALAAADDGPRAAESLGRPDPGSIDAPALVLFTSGTTADPKGVVHTSRTLTAEAMQFTRSYGLTWRDRCYLPVPLAHVTGMVFAVLTPGLVGGETVLTRMRGLDVAAGETVQHRATWTVGPVAEIPALAGALETAATTSPSLRIFATGGAMFPAEELALAEQLGIGPCRSYGMTEFPTVTTPSGADSRRQRLETDGRIPPGVECRAVDSDTREPLPVGEAGELCVRGPERMVGYLDPDETLAAVDEEGWFASGDLGRVDADGCVTVTGRIKDIINRGGEKFSARDIEEALGSHASVREVAVVAAPDDRFGEVPAAFVVADPGVPALSDVELTAWLRSKGMAAQKTPAHWRWVEELPLTPSGKVRKSELRQLLRDPPATES
jgi:acyl-CoA synthetase